jgi:O-acetyl-ADP-ribose deacetylase
MEIKIIKGDITEISADAIVNAANSSLLGGGGVDGAIHRKGGPQILDSCKKIRAAQGGCNTGDAVITPAGNLPAQFVIHTVGPIWEGGSAGEKELLKNAYLNSFKLAAENNIQTISFPNISTGVYAYPKTKAAETVFELLQELPLSLKSKIKTVSFVCFDDENFSIYSNLFENLLKNSIASLISETPVGLRGDRHLWNLFKTLSSSIPIPDKEEKLLPLLFEIFFTLTAAYPEKDKIIYVASLNQGGMSGGQIDSNIWLEKGFPAIKTEYLNKFGG